MYESVMFSVKLSIAADTMKLSVSSSVFLLTKYETDCLALSRLSFKSSLTPVAVSKSILTENDEDNKTENTTKNNITLQLHIK